MTRNAKPSFASRHLLALPAALWLAFAALPAHAVGNIADITVTDRSSGQTLPLHYHGGEYWVAGKPGAKYAISVRNKTGGRVLAVTSVDGVNVLNGETAAWDQTGYVFSPRQRYQVTGWRKSDSEVAAFQFSASNDSYAGRTGRPGNVGVIGVALFREKQPEPVAQSAPSASLETQRGESIREAEDASSANRKSMGRPSATPPAPPAPVLAEPSASSAMADKSASEMAAPAPQARIAPSPAQPRTPKLGTAHGERENSYTSETTFERLQAQPNEIIRIRYDSRENLIASGVIREPVALPVLPNPFPQSGMTSYVPDPPARRY